MNLTKLPSFILIDIFDLDLLLSIAWVFLLIPPAVLVARCLIEHINRRAFEWLMMIPLFVLSVYLLLFS